MSTAKERGALGKRFHELPTPADADDLSWEKMAPHILLPPPEEDPKRRIPIWWWVVGLILLLFAGGLYALIDGPFSASERAEEMVAQRLQSNPVTSPMVSGEGLTDGVEKKIIPTPEKDVGVDAFPEKRTNNGAVAQQSLPRTLPSTEALPTTIPPKEEPTEVPAARSVPSALAALDGPAPMSLEVPLASFNRTVRVPDLSPLEKGTKNQALSLLAGPLAYGMGYEPDIQTEDAQLSAQIRLGYERSIGKRWSISTGVDVRAYRFRTAFEKTDRNARIYQPGTIDTIFRNLTTGEERVVTTDTVGGTRIRRFGNDNLVTTVGIPVLLTRKWPLGNHQFSLGIGPRLGVVVRRSGKTVVGDHEVLGVAEAPQFGQNFRISGRLEGGYDWHIGPSWALSLRLGAETALNDWSSYSLGQRPSVLDGMIGVRWKWY